MARMWLVYGSAMIGLCTAVTEEWYRYAAFWIHLGSPLRSILTLPILGQLCELGGAGRGPCELPYAVNRQKTAGTVEWGRYDHVCATGMVFSGVHRPSVSGSDC